MSEKPVHWRQEALLPMSDAKGVPRNPPHVEPLEHEGVARAKFERGELRAVLSHYDLPPIVEIRSFPRGSRRSPKARIVTREGEFLLKRRAPGRDDAFHVAFTQEVEIFLHARGYPAPRLVGTRDTNNSMLQLGGRTYELFEFIHGHRFDRTVAASVQAGLELGKLHRLLAELTLKHSASTGGYHGVDSVQQLLVRANVSMRKVALVGDASGLEALTEQVGALYVEARDRVSSAGFDRWPRALCHGDWHPGNLLFREGVVVGVLDYDSARREARVADVANGALQFSMRIGNLEQMEAWPVELELPLLQGFLRGYDDGAQERLSVEEMSALAWLMIEALVVESVVPIAATGMFGRIPGQAFLKVVLGTSGWLKRNTNAIALCSD